MEPSALNEGGEVTIVRSDDGALLLRQDWLPRSWRWIAFGVTAVLFTVVPPLVFGMPGSAAGFALFAVPWSLLIYAMAAQCLNSTALRASAAELEWRHGPLPWRRGGRVEKSGIAAIVHGPVRRLSSTRGSGVGRSRSQRPSYGLAVRHKDRREQVIFFAFQAPTPAEITALMVSGRLGGAGVERGELRNPAELGTPAVLLIALAVLLLFFGTMAVIVSISEPVTPVPALPEELEDGNAVK